VCDVRPSVFACASVRVSVFSAFVHKDRHIYRIYVCLRVFDVRAPVCVCKCEFVCVCKCEFVCVFASVFEEP